MIALLRYNAGNVASVEYALKKLGCEVLLTDDPVLLTRADKVIFPGVGAAAPAMAYLQQRGLDSVIRSLRQPVLGICLGMQLLCDHTEEGNTPGLGVFPTQVLKFPKGEPVPHMGWNTVSGLRGPLFEGIVSEADVYFVHSYYAAVCTETIATADYIIPFGAALQKDNFWGTQFHPEKSGETGARILDNFLRL